MFVFFFKYKCIVCELTYVEFLLFDWKLICLLQFMAHSENWLYLYICQASTNRHTHVFILESPNTNEHKDEPLHAMAILFYHRLTQQTKNSTKLNIHQCNGKIINHSNYQVSNNARPYTNQSLEISYSLYEWNFTNLSNCY